MEMGRENVRAILDPYGLGFEGHYLAAARPRLEEARHGGQSLESRAQ
jgi:hypothetical protein